MKTFAFFSISCCLAFSAFASQPDVIGMDYGTARARLISEGYTPLTAEEVRGLPNAMEFPGPGESVFVAKGFNEVSSCTGSGIPFCKFLLKKPDGSVDEVVVYVPEGGGATRVEKIQGTSLKFASKIEVDFFATLQQRIALANKRKPHDPSDLEPCNSSCISTLINNRNLGMGVAPIKVSSFQDSVSGLNAPDFRGLHITELENQMIERLIMVELFPERDANIFQNDLPFIADQITGGAVQSCWENGSTTNCYLLYKGGEGYLYRLRVEGVDLASFRVTDVNIVNGLEEFAGHTTKQMAYAARKSYYGDLFLNNKSAYRAEMQSIFKDSKDPIILVAVNTDAMALRNVPCDIAMSSMYSFAVGGNGFAVNDVARQLRVERMLDQMVTMGCIRY